jgi:hypothetical protein
MLRANGLGVSRRCCGNTRSDFRSSQNTRPGRCDGEIRPDKHPRDKDGKFTDEGRAPSLSAKPATSTGPQRRSLESSTRVWKIGARTKELPIEYTGSRTKEHQVGTFLEHSFTAQIPKNVDPKDWHRLVRSLYDVANEQRTGVIDRGIANGYVPKGTPRSTVVKAYVHATKLAVAQFQVAKYHFKMDDHLKAEMTPMIPFIRYARRRLQSIMLGKEKGQWRPYRAAFGVPFKDLRRDKTTGEIRLRVPNNDRLVKIVPAHPPSWALHAASAFRG